MNTVPILMVLVATFIGAIASILLKKGSAKFNINPLQQIKNFHLVGGLSMHLMGSVVYISALRLGELSILYPLAAAQYIWISLLAKRFLNERMNKLKWIGVMLIIIGIIFINI